MGDRPTLLGAHPATSSSMKALPPFTSTHHTQPYFVDNNLALGLHLSRESLGEKERVGRVEKGVRSKESEQELKS